jgi:hypothetical protein
MLLLLLLAVAVCAGRVGVLHMMLLLVVVAAFDG